MHSMRPRSCGRSVRQHIRTASEGIWATDTLLALAFERYCAASPAARRHVSFAPGPLESRRRLGRRHMTELYSFQAHASLPPWAFDMPADLGKWNWFPATPQKPSAKESILERSEEDASQSWPSHLLDQFPRGVETSVSGDREANGLSPAEDDVESDMHWLMERIRWKDRGDIEPYVDMFIDSLKAHAKNGNLLPRHIHEITVTLVALLAVKHGNKKGSPHGLAPLLGAICEVTGSVKAAEHSEFDPSFWSLFLNQLQLLKGEPVACDIFAEFMSLIPAQHIRHVRDAVGAVLLSVSDNLRGPRVAPSPALEETGDAPTEHEPYKHPELWPEVITDMPFQRQAIPIAQGLNSFETELETSDLMGFVEAALDSAASRGKRIRHKVYVFWLSVLARLPLARQESLFRVMTKGTTRYTRIRSNTLSDAEVTQLLALHWTSRGYLQHPGQLLRTLSPDAQTPMLLQLVLAIRDNIPKSHCLAFFASLCQCLKSIRRLNSLVDAFEVLCMESDQLDARLFAFLGPACDDYASMIRLRRLATVHSGKFSKSARKTFNEFWDWRVWAKKTKELSRDPSVGPLELRELLSVDPQWQWKRKHQPLPDESSMIGGLSKHTVALLEQSARDIVTHFAARPPRGRTLERTALYLVTTRIRYLKAYGVGVTDPILKTLTQLLILDLVNHRPGRTSRFKWLMRLVAENKGYEEAEAVGRELAMWRKRNAQLALSRRRREVVTDEALWEETLCLLDGSSRSKVEPSEVRE